MSWSIFFGGGWKNRKTLKLVVETFCTNMALMKFHGRKLYVELQRFKFNYLDVYFGEGNKENSFLK